MNSPFKSMDEPYRHKPAALPKIDWETKMTFGKHAGESPREVAEDDPHHARGYFLKLEEVGKIVLTSSCRALLDDAVENTDSSDDEYEDETDDDYWRNK